MIFEFNGGLGNQMFQYAFYLSLKNRLPDLNYVCYIRRGLMEKSHYGYELQKVFGIEVKETGWLNTILSHTFYRKIQFPYRVIQDKRQGYDREVYNMIKNWSFVRGTWQSEKYFEDVKEEVRKAFTFRPITDLKNNRIVQAVQNSESVSVHVRRGDYLKHPSLYIDLAAQNYYQSAVEYMNEYVNTPKWFVFSDDINWCKRHLNIEDAVYVDHNTGELSYCDMYLMSMCKHNIIANSTFSWWGAWLNQNPEKIVVSPDIFMKNYNLVNRDTVCKNWKVINV